MRDANILPETQIHFIKQPLIWKHLMFLNFEFKNKIYSIVFVVFKHL